MQHRSAIAFCTITAALIPAPSFAQQTFYVDFDTIIEADPDLPGRPGEEFIHDYPEEDREFIIGYLNENFAP